jgi:hypothetical protein
MRKKMAKQTVPAATAVAEASKTAHGYAAVTMRSVR